MKTENAKQTKSLRYDLILIGALLAVSLAFVAVHYLTRVEGSYVEVRHLDDVVGTYSLKKDGTYTINGGTNILVVENGAAYVSYADCPGQRCVKKGKIQYVKQNIQCRHNKVIIEIIGDGGVDFEI